MKTDPASTRKEYQGSVLTEDMLPDDPVELFTRWLDEAANSGTPEPTAMNLATADAGGRVSSRMVLLKGIEQGGFLFFSHYNSRKARALEENPNAALTFYWPETERQVRIEGTVKKIPASESDKYFESRPRDSQIGAHASLQSKVLENRKTLDEKFIEMKERFTDVSRIPRPVHWGGYRVVPLRIEFWQGRKNRLHDRIEFESNGNNNWKTRRLYP